MTNENKGKVHLNVANDDNCTEDRILLEGKTLMQSEKGKKLVDLVREGNIGKARKFAWENDLPVPEIKIDSYQKGTPGTTFWNEYAGSSGEWMTTPGSTWTVYTKFAIYSYKGVEVFSEKLE